MPRFVTSAAAFACCVLASASAYAQFGNLTNRVPDGANTLILVDVNKLHRSPLGMKENWKAEHEKSFAGGVSAVPADASRFVMSAKMDFVTMAPDWQVSIMDLNYEPSVPKAALRYRGTVDRISDREVAILPGDVYAVKFGPKIVGVGTPANRQDVGRWINRIYGNSLRGLTPYLKEAQGFAEGNSPITMAMDLNHTVSVEELKGKLADWPPLQATDKDLGAFCEALASIRGVTLGVTVTDSITGAVKVDFAKDVTILGELAKPLLLHVLAKHGAMISEMDAWKANVSGNTVQITGPLYASGMRRILSVLDPPPSLQQPAPPTGQQGSAEDQQKLAAMASQTYFKAVTSLIDDLKNDRQNRQTMGQISVWFGKYAKKIDRLPILNVDESLLEYGKFVSESLRTGQLQVTGAAARSRVRQNDVPEQYDVRTWGQPIGVVRGGGYGYGGYRGAGGVYGWGGWTAKANDRARGQLQSHIRTQEQIKGNMSASLVLQGIDNATADVRRYLTQKYQVEF